ncbi:MAG TPA: hypothetical protein VMZ33_00145 [Candidatus Limnocylindrales bacterium]|nr:hypothetical protein [Candidatus Limnocylindrales bacterium]
MPTVEPRTAPATRSRRPSRAPVLLVIIGFGLATTLVLIGALLASLPAPKPSIDQPGTVESPRSLNVIMRDYRFDPTPIYVVRGETIRLTVLNGGLIEHELVLGDAQVQSAWAAADAAATPPAPFATAPPASVSPDVGGLRVVLASGASQVVDYTVPTSSAEPIQMVCHLPGHVARGMIGAVELSAR